MEFSFITASTIKNYKICDITAGKNSEISKIEFSLKQRSRKSKIIKRISKQLKCVLRQCNSSVSNLTLQLMRLQFS